jgi:hypothetical protein
MRRRNGNSIDTDVERELAAIDAALSGKPVEAGLADLANLARAIRAERPRPRPGFNAALDVRVREGFRAQEPGASPRDAKRSRRLVPVAAGAAASLLIVVTAVLSSGVLSGGSGGHEVSAGRGAPAETPSAESAPTSAAPTAKLRAPAQALTGDQRLKVVPRVRNRQVEHDAALTLAARSDKVEDTADGVIEVTDRYGGFVLRSNVTGGDRSSAGATLDLRIPADRLQPALRDLSGLAHVRSRTQSSQDITARFVSARSRLRDALTERRALLRQLAHATTANETASIRARLRISNREIAIARSNLRSLRNRIDFSKVGVTIEADDTLSSGGGSWTPGDALHDALGVLGVAAGVALVTAAVLLPVLAIGLLVLLASRRIVRERRNRALDL